MSDTLESVVAWAALLGMVGWVGASFWRGLRRGLRGEPQLPTSPGGAPSTRVPKTPAPLGDLARANEIMLAYAALLQDGHAGLRPETDLPAPKADVKDALLAVGQYWHARGMMTPERVSQLKASFGLLADFVPGGDRGFAAAVADARHALATPGTPPEVARAAAERIAAIMQDGNPYGDSARGMQDLYDEWDVRWAEVVRGAE